MSSEVLKIRLISVKDCFLRFSPAKFPSISGSSVCAVKLNIGDRDLFFSVYPKPSAIVKDSEVGLSATYAKFLNLEENDCVIVYRLSNVGSIPRIHASPITEEDLEILSSSSGDIEKSLLNQLRIVWPGQVFPVWITPSMFVTLVTIDYLFPNLICGRLEEYSEIVIQDVVQKIPKKVKKDIKPLVDESIVFRCVPLEGVLRSNSTSLSRSKWYFKPYEVYINMHSSPIWLLSLLENNETSLWTLSEHESQPSIAKERIKVESDETNSPDMADEIVVRLRLAEDSFGGLDIGKFQSLYVSKIARNHLGLRSGSKVVLKQVGDLKKKTIAGLIITPCFEKTPLEAEVIKRTFQSNLSSIVGQSKTMLLNSKAPFPLNENENVLVTLRPLDIRWGLINRFDLKSLLITVIKSERVAEIENLKSQKEKKNVIPSFELLLLEGFFTIDLSLGLSSGLKQDTVDSFMDNMIIVGKPGSGKTILSDLLLNKVSSPPYSLHGLTFDCRLLKGKRLENLCKVLNQLFNICEYYQPSVLFLDNISAVASVPKPDQENSEASFHMKRVSYKMAEIIERYQRNNLILVICTTDSIESVNPRLFSPRGKSVFTTVIKIPDLSLEDRCEFLCHLICEKAPDTKPYLSTLDINKFSTLIDGFVARDLVRLAMKALFEAWQRKVEENVPLIISKVDLEVAFTTSTPAALQGLNLYKGPKHTFDDVGGLKKAKEQLVQVVLWPTLYPEIMSQCPLKQQNAILLYGFPGTGKTLLASAVAGESKLNFITVKGPELMSKYIGESEEAVRKLFERAQSAKPCLLFFDEFDSLAPRRGKDQVGVTDRVVNQFLTALDGVEPMTGVTVIAATNRPDIIDPALLRPGRIGTYVFCDLPSKDERYEILQRLCSQVPLSKNVNLEEIAEKTCNFSGADLKGLITSAQIRLIDNLVEFSQDNTEPVMNGRTKMNVPEVSQEDLIDTLIETKPSLSSKDRLNFEDIYNSFIRGSVLDISEQKMTFA